MSVDEKHEPWIWTDEEGCLRIECECGWGMNTNKRSLVTKDVAGYANSHITAALT